MAKEKLLDKPLSQLTPRSLIYLLALILGVVPAGGVAIVQYGPRIIKPNKQTQQIGTLDAGLVSELNETVKGLRGVVGDLKGTLERIDERSSSNSRRIENLENRSFIQPPSPNEGG